LPQSRKRKTRRGGPSSRATYSSKKQSNNTTRLVIYVVIAALAIGALVYLLSLLTGTGQSPNVSAVPGTEVTTPSGLKYVDEVIGTGATPRAGQTITVHYTGTLEDGTKFDSSRDQNKPLSRPIGVGLLIKGWDEGIMSMRVGGRRKLIVPPSLGYGPSGNPPDIPPNATLYFDVELLGVK
jgi:peptidylprolyl isomerase